MGAPTFPLIGLERHRIGIDGEGVTTLAAAHGKVKNKSLQLNV